MSFILEWNGLKLAYSSDTFPNKWWRAPDPKLQRAKMSQEMVEGRIVDQDVLEDVYAYINEKFGSNEQVP